MEGPKSTRFYDDAEVKDTNSPFGQDILQGHAFTRVETRVE